MAKRLLETLLLLFLGPALAHGEDVLQRRLDEGLRNYEAYSYVLLKEARQAPVAEAGQLLRRAVEASPDVPALHFALSGWNLRHLPGGLFEWMQPFIEGFRAYKRGWWWCLSLAGLLLSSLLAATLFTVAMVVLVRLPQELPLLKHEVEEDRRKLLLLLPLLLALPFGAGPFLLSLLVVLGLYFRGASRALLPLALLVLLLWPLLTGAVAVLLGASSPQLRATVAVNEGRDNTLALQALRGRQDFASLFSLALALKRRGRLQEALELYQKAWQKRPQEHRVLTNQANCYFLMGQLQRAKELYELSLSIRPTAAAYYNLGQLYRERLEFSRGDELFRQASQLDRERVSAFTARASRQPNRFLMDEHLGPRDFLSFLRLPSLPPGAWGSPLLALLLGASLGAMRRRRFKALRCSRCQKVLCPRCERNLQWGHMCGDCYRSLVKMESVEPRERVNRLLMIHERQNRQRTILRLLSFAPPGVAHLYAGHLLSGTVALWVFSFLVLLMLLNPLLETGLGGLSHNWLSPLLLPVALALYLTGALRARRLQWL